MNQKQRLEELKRLEETKRVDKETKFFEELTALSHKYQLFIGGCGCCGSPWVEHKDNATSLKYIMCAGQLVTTP